MIVLTFRPDSATQKIIELEHIEFLDWPCPKVRKKEIRLLKGKATQYSGFFQSDKTLIIEGYTEKQSIILDILTEYLIKPPIKALAPDEFLNVRRENFWVSKEEKMYEMSFKEQPIYNEIQLNDKIIYVYKLVFSLIKEVDS